jgi:pimeloyl-ACP methyl ester carboxylesterase
VPESLLIPTADGRHLEVLVSGPKNGPVLVFHTGTPAGLVPLPDDLDPASDGIRTVLYARPGYGRSTPHPNRSVADVASDTTTILDALEVKRFLNLGWSGGGPHALACDALLVHRCQATAVIAGLAPYAEDEPGGPIRSYYEADEDNRKALAGDVVAFRKGCEELGSILSRTRAEHLVANTGSEPDRRFFSDEHGSG